MEKFASVMGRCGGKHSEKLIRRSALLQIILCPFLLRQAIGSQRTKKDSLQELIIQIADKPCNHLFWKAKLTN